MQSYNAILPTNNVIFTLLGEQKERHIAGAVTLISVLRTLCALKAIMLVWLMRTFA